MILNKMFNLWGFDSPRLASFKSEASFEDTPQLAAGSVIVFREDS